MAAGCHQIKQSENTSLLKNRLPMQREFKEDVLRKNDCADLINYQIIFNPFWTNGEFICKNSSGKSHYVNEYINTSLIDILFKEQWQNIQISTENNTCWIDVP